MLNIKEGDFVMGQTTEGIIHGRVEHVMDDGGVYGVPGTEYSIQSTPENPAMAVRVFEETETGWQPTAYSIGMLYSDASLVNIKDHSMKSDTPMDVAYNPTVTDPIAASSNGNGIKRPQYMLNQPRQTKPKTIHNKPGVDIWAGSAFGKSNCCPENISKQDPCWEGYVQRGMKPGDNGKPVPNCVPVAKAAENPIMPTDTYQVPEYDGCGCETCMQLNVNCDNCPVCGPTQVNDVSELGKSIFNLETAASLITKQTIRWDK
jgi:hypothetical protein